MKGVWEHNGGSYSFRIIIGNLEVTYVATLRYVRHTYSRNLMPTQVYTKHDTEWKYTDNDVCVCVCV